MTSATIRFFAFIAVFLCFFSCADTSVVPPEKPTSGPQIQEPVFSVSSIKIMQAELINTLFRVKLRIDNPNTFPVTLSSFEYKLYGEGRFWADGNEKNVLTVPASGFAEKDLSVVMNFIDMKRDLLDKVIAMESVEYRFTGSVTINAGDMPLLIKNFDLEGMSEVIR